MSLRDYMDTRRSTARYSEADLVAAVEAGFRVARSAVDICDGRSLRVKSGGADYPYLVTASVSCDSTADINRSGSASFLRHLVGEDTAAPQNFINWAADVIRLWYIIAMPDGGEAWFSAGYFALGDPTDEADDAYRVTTTVAISDLTYRHRQDIIGTQFSKNGGIDYARGDRYRDEVEDLLDLPGATIRISWELDEDHRRTQSTTVSADTDRLTAALSLLAEINALLYVDRNGVFHVIDNADPSESDVDYYFSAGSSSITTAPGTTCIGTTTVPNVVQYISSGGGTNVALIAEAVNNDTSNPFSVAARGYRVVLKMQVSATYQSLLQKMANRKLNQVTSRYTYSISPKTLVMPIFEPHRTYRVASAQLGYDALFREISWAVSLDLADIDAAMLHVMWRNEVVAS